MQVLLTEEEYADLKELADKAESYEKLYNELMSQHLALKDEHEKLVEYTRKITDKIFIVWNSMKEYFLPKNGNAKYFKNSKLLWTYLKDFLQNTDKKYLILFKGSQNTIFMEEALKQILKHKSDETNICRQEKFWLEKKNTFFNEK